MVAISSSPSATARTILSGCFFFLTLSFFSHHVAAVSFSFNFSNPSNYHLIDLRFEGDAALNQNSDLVDLTCNSKDPNENSYCKGRMSYNHPVPLYDNGTGEVASFATTFTFGIHMLPNTSLKGDGMAFFLSAYPSRLLPESGSELLGLTNSSNTSATGADRFIAIEFDTYANPWDPTRASDHIGIDLSSITSVSTTRLPTDSLNTTMTATITFDNTTRMLEATLHFDDARQSQAAGRVKTQLPDNLDALLPPEVAVGFSAATGGYKELHQIHSWSFNSTMASREKPTGPNRLQPKQGQIVGMEGRHSRALVTGGAVVGALVLAVVICSTLSWCTWTRRRDSFGKGSRLKHIEYGDLTIATKGFSEDNKIGEGGFGKVYSGNLGKKPVAVKRIKDTTGEFKDFLAELSAIDGTFNGNVVRLEGWCCHINNFMFWWLHRKNIKLFIVYELVPNGNLHEHLHEKPEVVLPWATRYKIVMGIGSALRHLHHECKPYILHRDIKPSNILLDNEFNAKLGDFGLSRVAHDNLQTSVQTGVAIGTRGYMDPLCMQNGQVKLRTSSDVYSFGVVLLEMAHGENNTGEVRRLHKYEPKTFVTDVADKKLAGIFETTEMERVIVLGLRCSDPEENQRPSLNGAMEYLVKGGELLPATREERHDLDPAFPSAAPAELGHSQQPRS